MHKQRVTFYIDGFNFFNGLRTAKRQDRAWGRFYWLDIVKFCQQFIGENQELVKVKYFTASPKNVLKRKNQKDLFKANKLINGNTLEIIYGQYKDKPIICQAKCKMSFIIPEEKRTDVNISIHLVTDCLNNLTDKVVLISADSDLVPPIEYIKKNTNKKVSIIFPPHRKCYELDNAVGRKATKLEKHTKTFSRAIMPETISVNGSTITIPEKWAAYSEVVVIGKIDLNKLKS